jgi:hypothetical protein
MNKFLLALVVMLAVLCLLAFQGSPRGIIEGEGFRLVRNGQTLWEMKPAEDGGVTITFSPNGKVVCGIGFDDKTVGFNCKIGGTEANLVIAGDVYGNSVSVDNGKALMNRLISSEKKDGKYFIADDLRMPTSEIQMRVAPDTAWQNFRAGLGDATFKLNDNEASLRGKVRDDVKLEIEVGDVVRGLTCLGNLVKGFVVKLANQHGKWSWSNDK